MKFTPFAENRVHMQKQYARFAGTVNGADSKALYRRLQACYYAEHSRHIGKGKALRLFFEQVQLFINPHDIFADIADVSHTPILLRREEYERFKQHDPQADIMREAGAFEADCDFGHTMPDWNVLLTLGFPGILAQTQQLLKKEDLTEDQRDFYRSVCYAYEGILIYVNRLQEKAALCGTENTRFAAENLKQLSVGAPQTLAEAMQLFFLYYTAQHWVEGENLRSLGALDDLLYPFYLRDVQNGACEEDIRELLRYFLFKWYSLEATANIPFNLATHTNELTYLILEEYTRLNIPDPKIHIKCSADTPEQVYRMVMDSIRRGNNSFVFTNDTVIQKALAHIGVDPEDAQDYTLVGCYEPCVVGKEIPCTVNGRIHLPLAVETALNGGMTFSSRPAGIPAAADFSSFEQLYAQVKQQLQVWADAAMAEVNAIEAHYPKIIQSPILSATYRCCMEQGKDAYAGGAKYANSSLCIFGIATIVDSLIAIKKAVFEEKRISLSDLVQLLKNNWQGGEALRKHIRDSYPKYGTNDPEADALATDLVAFMAGCLNNKPNGRGGVFRMGMFSIDWILYYGSLLGASADGRLAGEPISKNLCASVGMDKKGITGLIHSASKFDFTQVPNGAVLDLHLHPSAVKGEEGIEVMTALLKTYLSHGGFAAHFNIVDPETLRKAQKEPEKYRNLQVRLCGWNVYFTDLNTQMQDNLIRTMEGSHE